MKQKISITLNNKILRDVDSIVDNIFIRNRSQAIEHLIKKALKESKIAVILAGDSSKLSTSDRIRNRYSIKINNMSLIERAIRKLGNSGFKSICIIATHDILTNIFRIVGDGSDFNVKIDYINEESQNGTASAIKLLKGKIKSTFLLVHSDIIFDHINLNELWQKHLQDKAVITILIGSPYDPKENSMHGNVSLEGNRVVRYIEKPDRKSLESSTFARGIYVIEPEVLSSTGNSLEFEVIPELIKKRLVNGYLSSTDHLHIHTKRDVKEVKKKFKELSKK